jgi:hypothetical protein
MESEPSAEVKLSEADFGKAKNDQRHLDKLTGIYSPVLVRHLEASRLEQRAFFDGYQFYRNVGTRRAPKAANWSSSCLAQTRGSGTNSTRCSKE